MSVNKMILILISQRLPPPLHAHKNAHTYIQARWRPRLKAQTNSLKAAASFWDSQVTKFFYFGQQRSITTAK